MRRTLSVVAALALTATACGSSGSSNALEAAIKAETGQNVDVQQNGDGFTIETDEGSITFGGDGTDITGTDDQGNEFNLNSGTDVPPDFPLPVPDNVDISSATTFEMPEGKSFGLIFDFDPSRVDEISKLYVDALNSQGLSVDGTGSSPDGEVIVGDSDTLGVIVVLDNYGDYWEASISWTPF